MISKHNKDKSVLFFVAGLTVIYFFILSMTEKKPNNQGKDSLAQRVQKESNFTASTPNNTKVRSEEKKVVKLEELIARSQKCLDDLPKTLLSENFKNYGFGGNDTWMSYCKTIWQDAEYVEKNDDNFNKRVALIDVEDLGRRFLSHHHFGRELHPSAVKNALYHLRGTLGLSTDKFSEFYKQHYL